jgi:hypothetical protein
LNTEQLNKLIERRVIKPMGSLTDGRSSGPDNEWAVQETYISLMRECRRGEENPTLLNADERHLASIQLTTRRKLFDVDRSKGTAWRRPSQAGSQCEDEAEPLYGDKADGRAGRGPRYGRRQPPRILPLGGEEAEPTAEPILSHWLVMGELQELLRRIEPIKMYRVMYWFRIWERDAGEKGIGEAAAAAFGCSRQTVHRRMTAIEERLAGYA